MLPMGRFTYSRDYLLARLRLRLDQIMREDWSNPRVIDTYLVSRFFLDCVSKKIFYSSL
ncbi:hypothetical protein BDV12DRAFT_171132, partial [Aspergillus spectabilis]